MTAPRQAVESLSLAKGPRGVDTTNSGYGADTNEPCLSGWLPIKFFGESICHCTAFRTLEPLRWQPTQELS